MIGCAHVAAAAWHKKFFAHRSSKNDFFDFLWLPPATKIAHKISQKIALEWLLCYWIASLDHLLDRGTQILAVHHPQPVALAKADGAEFCPVKRGVLDEEQGVCPSLDVYAGREPGWKFNRLYKSPKYGSKRILPQDIYIHIRLFSRFCWHQN